MLLSMQMRLKADAELSTFRLASGASSRYLVRLSVGQHAANVPCSNLSAAPLSGTFNHCSGRYVGSFEPWGSSQAPVAAAAAAIFAVATGAPAAASQLQSGAGIPSPAARRWAGQPQFRNRSQRKMALPFSRSPSGLGPAGSTEPPGSGGYQSTTPLYMPFHAQPHANGQTFRCATGPGARAVAAAAAAAQPPGGSNEQPPERRSCSGPLLVSDESPAAQAGAAEADAWQDVGLGQGLEPAADVAAAAAAAVAASPPLSAAPGTDGLAGAGSVEPSAAACGPPQLESCRDDLLDQSPAAAAPVPLWWNPLLLHNSSMQSSLALEVSPPQWQSPAVTAPGCAADGGGGSGRDSGSVVDVIGGGGGGGLNGLRAAAESHHRHQQPPLHHGVRQLYTGSGGGRVLRPIPELTTACGSRASMEWSPLGPELLGRPVHAQGVPQSLAESPFAALPRATSPQPSPPDSTRQRAAPTAALPRATHRAGAAAPDLPPHVPRHHAPQAHAQHLTHLRHSLQGAHNASALPPPQSAAPSPHSPPLPPHSPPLPPHSPPLPPHSPSLAQQSPPPRPRARGPPVRSSSWYGGAPVVHPNPTRVAPDVPIELRLCRSLRELLDGLSELRLLRPPLEDAWQDRPDGAAWAGAGLAARAGPGRERRRSQQQPCGGQQRPGGPAIGRWVAGGGLGAGGGGDAAAAGEVKCRSIVMEGRWQGQPVAVKLVAGPGLEARSAALGSALAAVAVLHPHLVRVHCMRLLPPAAAGVIRPKAEPEPAAAADPQSAGSQAGRALGGGKAGGAAAGAAAVTAAASEALAALERQPGEGLLAAVMELCPMGSLAPLARAAYSPFRPNRAWPAYLARRALLRTAIEVCDALVCLHGFGLAHGALRASNVLLVPALRDRRTFLAKLSDVGLACSVLGDGFGQLPSLVSAAADTDAGLLCLAPAPDAVDGTRLPGPVAAGVGRRYAEDVYAFGALLWELATGEAGPEEPGQAGRPDAGSAPWVAPVAAPAPAWPNGAHPHLRALYEACVCADPEQRPTMQQVCAELHALDEALRAERPRGRAAAAAGYAALTAAAGREAPSGRLPGYML